MSVYVVISTRHIRYCTTAFYGPGGGSEGIEEGFLLHEEDEHVIELDGAQITHWMPHRWPKLPVEDENP